MIPFFYTSLFVMGMVAGIQLGGFLADRRSRQVVIRAVESANEREKIAAQQIAHAYESTTKLMGECRQVITESRNSTRDAMAEATAIAKLAARTMFGGAEVTEPPAPSSLRDNDRSAAVRQRNQG